MTILNALEGPPEACVTYHVADGEWELDEDFSYFDPWLWVTLTVWAGFRFDLASIPRAFWHRVAPMELSIEAALLHDALYAHGGLLPPTCVQPVQVIFRRVDADKLFLRMMRAYSVGAVRRNAAYLAVRVFGGPHWKG